MAYDQFQQHDYVVEQKLRELIQVHTTNLPGVSPAHVFTVPDEFRIGNEQHFEPKRFSIGLIHAQDQKLMATKGMKRIYLYSFIQHLSDTRNKNGSELIISCLSSHSKTFITYYDNVPDKLKSVRGDEFLEVLLLDACFIVKLLISFDWESITSGKLLRKEDETLVFTLRQDLLKFENQIPFPILADLAALALQNVQDSRKKLIESALSFFQIPKSSSVEGLDGVNHLLELVLLSQFPRPSGTLPPANYGKPSYVTDFENILNQARTASELENYGIQLQPKNNTTNLADIEFKKGVLYIPRLEIDANFPSMAWNFLIFEIYRESGMFLSYVMLMDVLIRSEKDVEVLIRAGILKVWFNDLQLVVSLFDKLSTNLDPSGFHFTDLLQDLNTYCDSYHRRVRADFMRRYHADRWDMLNSILLFILTVTQTLFSVLSYDPKKTPSKSH